MEMHQLRYFVALAGTLNFTRAAERCGVTQPSLTRAIRQLEHELGGELVRRERSLTHLTELGERLLPLLRQCCESAEQARALGAATRARRLDGVRFAVSRCVDFGAVSAAVSATAAGRGSTRLRVARLAAAEIADTLREGCADLALCPTDGMTWDRFESWPFAEEPLALAAGAGHRLAGPAPVRLAALAGERPLLRRHCHTLEATVHAFSTAGARLDAAIEVEDDGDLKRLLAEGAGVAIAPPSLTLGGQARTAPIEDLRLARRLRIYAVRGRRRGPAAAELLRRLRAAADAWSGAAASPRARDGGAG